MFGNSKRKWTVGLLGVAMFVAPLSVRAEEEAAEASEWSSKLSLSGGVDFTTHYFFRGILQENQDLIVQPYATLGYNLYEGDGALSSIDGVLGVWGSIHGGPTGGGAPGGAPHDPRAWYEQDFFAGVTATLYDKWTIGAIYTVYISPNDSFDTVNDITFSLAYDDSDCWVDFPLADFSLAPYVQFIVETRDEADGGNSVVTPGGRGSDQGLYVQLGATPSFTLIQSEDYPVTLGVPLVIGLGDDYYEVDKNGDGNIDRDSTFGFFSVGLTLSTPLAFVPESLGSWTAKVGVNYILLGNTPQFINNGEGDEVIGTLGLGVSF